MTLARLPNLAEPQFSCLGSKVILHIQACIRDIVGLVPGHGNKANMAKKEKKSESCELFGFLVHVKGFPSGSAGKNLLAKAGDTGDMGSIFRLGRSLEEGMATHSKIIVWRIPWTVEPGRLQSTGSHRAGHD